MHRRLVAIALVVASHGATSAVAQQAEGSVTDEPSRQLLGAQLGVEAGGEVTPGGLRIAGSFLYRASDEDFLDSSVGFTFGSGDPRCFRDRDNDVVCDHGLASGFAAEVVLAVRRDFNLRGRYVPFARAGLAIRLIGFGDDDVQGLGVPFLLSGGARARVHKILSVVAMADVRTGWSFFNRGLGLEPHASFALSTGVEFDID